MDYKKILPNRDIRMKLIRLLSFVPDKLMIKFQYYIKTGRRLNLKNPKRFTEKLQWYKLYYKNPEMIRCVDKYEVRSFVAEKGLENILIPCYGVFDRVEDIDWEKLPNQFVMKDTLGGGGTSVIIVRDKKSTNIKTLELSATKWLALGRAKDTEGEWPYHSGKKHRVIIEQYIYSDPNRCGLIDYKFFCFNGRAEFLYVMGDRVNGKSVKVGIYDRSFNKLDVIRVGDEDIGVMEKPIRFEELRDIAEKLASGFPHVRVDLYDVEGCIYFGELTFYNASGYMKYDPDQFDYFIGERFILP